MKKILVTFEVVQGEYESTEYVAIRDNEWTDEDLLTEVYSPNGKYNKEYNYWEDDYGERIIKVHFVSSITDEELKVLKKFNMVYDIWEDLHSPEKYNYKEQQMKNKNIRKEMLGAINNLTDYEKLMLARLVMSKMISMKQEQIKTEPKEEIWQDELTQLFRADELLMLDEENWIDDDNEINMNNLLKINKEQENESNI